MERSHTPRPLATALAIATAGAIAFSTTVGPTLTESSIPIAPRVWTQTVQLTALPTAFQQVFDIATGKDSTYPLPVGSNPLAPIAEQVMRSVATYGTELLTGKAGQIPGEISSQVTKLAAALPTVRNLVADAIGVVPVVFVSLVFNTALGLAGLVQGANTLPYLATVWKNAALIVPLKFAYNAFAIRNTIAMALQPSSEQPSPASATRKSSSPARTRAAAAHSTSDRKSIAGKSNRHQPKSRAGASARR